MKIPLTIAEPTPVEKIVSVLPVVIVVPIAVGLIGYYVVVLRKRK